MKLTLIVENKTYKENIQAEHGLALLIETDEKSILFDSGASDILIKNAENMELDLSTVDLAVLSHGHYDHSGGFPAFNKINPNAKIYLQESALKETFPIDKRGKLIDNNIGIRWTDEEKKRLEPNLVFVEEPTYITENIIISGSIPENMREKKTEQFLKKVGENQDLDKMEHEQCLIIKENGKLNIFSGCSHNGIVPIVEYSKKLFPGLEIKTLFGGFHLYNSQYDQLGSDVKRVSSLGAQYVIPVHCTGLSAISGIKEYLHDGCIIMNAGDNLFV